jgi:DNA-directed RNA polymerase subunit RPC12/RpoP
LEGKMSTGKIIGYIFAGILVFFGVLWLLSAFSSETLNPGGRLLVGGVLVVVGLGVIFLVRMREPKPKQEITVRQEIDIGGDVEMEAFKCTSCGAQLDKSAISLTEGAVMVTCPYCSATYQIVEEPKW